MRKPIIVGNWKMNKSYAEAETFVTEVIPGLPTDNSVEAVIAPEALFIPRMIELAKESPLKISAQNCYYEDEGPFTGEISPTALSKVGTSYVIVGHSERRQVFYETDLDINFKIKAVIRNKMIPILCCGETFSEHESGRTIEIVSKQIISDLQEIENEHVSNMIIAYEPVWAIGTGETATAAQAQEVCKNIRQVIAEEYDENIASKIRIQYGGSVKPDNVKEMMSQPDIDGALVGGASLKANSFLELVNYQN